MIDRLRQVLHARLARQPALANVLRLLAGNAAAQGLTLAAYPVLTRLFTPSEIGVLSALMAAVTIFAPAAALRLEMALPVSRTEPEAGSMLVASAMALLLTTFAMTVLLAVLPTQWPGDMAPAAAYRWFLPLALFSFGGYVIMVNEATRRNRFAEIARTRVMQAVSGPTCQIGAGLLGLGTLGLVGGYVIGQGSGTLGLVWRLLRGPASPLKRWSWASVRAAVSRHRDFALYSSWTGVVSAAGTYLVTIAFAFIYGPAVSGFMFLGERVLMRPLSMITLAILPVYTREVAQVRIAHRTQLPGLFAGVVLKQSLLSLAWIAPIALAAPWIIPWAFGPGWAESAGFVQVLALGYFPTSVMQPVIHTLEMLGQQRFAAALDVGRSASAFAAIGMVAWMGVEPMTGAIIWSATQAVAQGVVLALTWWRVRQVAAS